MMRTASTRVNRIVGQVRMRKHLSAQVCEQDVMALHNGSGAPKGGIGYISNFTKESEDATNAHIVKEFFGSMSYLAMYAYFDRADVALPGFAKWSFDNSNEEKQHAEKMIEYMNKRGGKYVPQPTPAPARSEFASALEALEYARTLEVTLNDSLLALHSTAAGDPAFQDFLETDYLPGQVNSINEISKIMRKLMRAGPGRGEYEIDRELGA